MTINISSNKDLILKKISQNLGLDSKTPGSYIRTLVDGLEDFSTKNIEGINTAIKELYLETASDLTVERYASKKGLSRLKSKNLLVTSEDLSISLHPMMFRSSEGLSITLFSKGDVILEDIYVITFLEDVIYDSDLDRVYISCMLEMNNLYADLTVKIESGTSLDLKIPGNFSNLFQKISLNVNKDLFFSTNSESSDLFRRRVLSAMRSSNISGDSHVIAAINSIPGVDQFYIDKNIYPTKIYILNNAVYNNFEMEYITEDTSIPSGQALLNEIKSYGNTFDIEHAERVSFTVDVEMDVSSGEQILKSIMFFKDLIKEGHTLGKEYLVNKDMFETFLTLRDINKPFKFSLYLYFNGIKIPAKDLESILIEKHQFPYVEELTLNGEVLNVQDYQE